jgi:predicted HD superfamily hydrolase involved in NAD metabolism
VTSSFPQLCKAVRADLAQAQRYAHSVRVARLGELLALAHAEDTRRARIAGMLHDLARLYSAERLLRECGARGMPIDGFERAHPVVLHARLSAELARERYHVGDETILCAIRAHTLAAPAMSRLDCVVYLADALEPGREFPERETYLGVAYADLNEAMRLVLGSSLAYLRGRGLEPAPRTLAATRWFAAPGATGIALEENRMEDRRCRT